MLLGYRGNPAWRDMSQYVVHFAKDTAEGSAYDAMLSVLSEGRLEARNRFGCARAIDSVGGQHAVCLSEVPLDLLDRLVERRGTKFGIAFTQEKLLAAGGGRVWYVDKDSEPAEAVRRLIQRAQEQPHEQDHPLWQLTPLIDFPGEFGGTQYRFEWEREWRVPGHFEFAPADVAFLFIPEQRHEDARAFFEGVRADNAGPYYDCPFLDPLWSDERIQEALHDE